MGLDTIIETGGMIGILLVVFAESGLFFGFFLPGDSLLFTAGLLASRGDFNIVVLLIGCPLMAIAGDQVGYAFGRKVGPAIFNRPDSRLFKRENVDRAQAFFDKHGSKTIVLARFVPIVRTFAPIVAGVSEMKYRTFVTFNIIGGILWGFGVTLMGYLLGKRYPHLMEDNELKVIAVIIALSLLPIGIEYLKHRRSKDNEKSPGQ